MGSACQPSELPALPVFTFHIILLGEPGNYEEIVHPALTPWYFTICHDFPHPDLVDIPPLEDVSD